MSLYGINAYNTSNFYSSMLSSKNPVLNSGKSSLMDLLNNNSKSKKSGSSDIYEFMKGIANTNSGDDLMTLAKNIDLVRSKGFTKKMTEEYRKIFSGQTVSSDEAQSSKDTELKLSKSAKALSSSAGKLVSGNMEYYKDSKNVLSDMKDFVKNYNSTLDGLKESQSTLALQKGVSMVSSTAAYSKSLSKIGITVGADNKLTLNEDKFAEADMNSVKSLFSGNYSFASKTAEKANYIDRTAQIQAQTTYNSQGKPVNYYNHAMVNSMFSNLF